MDLASVFTYILNAASIALPGVFQVVHEDKPVRYDNAQVWRTALRSKKDIKTFQEFEVHGDISVWKMNKKIVDYLVTGENRQRIQRALHRKRLDHDVLITDVQRKINATKVEPARWTDVALRKGHRLNFHSYPNNEVIDEYIEHLGVHYPSITRVSEIGRSVENRAIKMIRISNGNPNNKIILLVGGEHAREWVAITSPLYIANNIITKFDKQPSFMRNKDWYIIPLLNPDGYDHSQKVDRLWRKNKRVNPNPICPGVDLNRNFPYNWNIENVRVHEYCKQDYAGPHSLSEPEARALVRVLDAMGDKKPSGYMDFHSYGQYIIYPWSAVNIPSPYENILYTTANKIRQVINQSTRRKYITGTAPELLYSASGTAVDFFHSKGVRTAYAFEGRDTLKSKHGFLLPPNQIEGTGKEMLAAARTIAREVDDLKKEEKNEWF